MNNAKMSNYSFIIDGGLHVCARAEDEKIARKRIEEQWPRAKIELKGVDLPSAERNLFSRPAPAIGTTGKASDKATAYSAPSKWKKESDKLGLTETEASLVAAFA